MPRPAQETSGEARRYPLNMRIASSLRTQLKRAADANGRSLTQQIEHLIERDADQSELLGGPEGRRAVYAMGTAFLTAGQFSAGQGVPVREWLENPTACVTGIVGAVTALVRALPHLQDDIPLRHLDQALHSALASMALRQERST
jgi:hypothetical protein